MNVHQSPVGLFDSGLGGLSVAIEVHRALPRERLLYAADNRFCPYGSRSESEIRWRSRLMVEALIERGAKLLVIACNTATAFALEELRSDVDIPIIGLEPALKPAIARSNNRKVGVLATPRTAGSGRLQRLIETYAGDASVLVVPAPGFVELVEGHLVDPLFAAEVVEATVQPLVEAGVDTVVLGCTHYPFLRELIANALGPEVALIDSGSAIARRVQTLLEGNDLLADTTIPGDLEVLTTGEVDNVRAVSQRLLGRPVRVKALELPTVSHTEDYDASLPPKLSAAWTISASAGA